MKNNYTVMLKKGLGEKFNTVSEDKRFKKLRRVLAEYSVCLMPIAKSTGTDLDRTFTVREQMNPSTPFNDARGIALMTRLAADDMKDVIDAAYSAPKPSMTPPPGI